MLLLQLSKHILREVLYKCLNRERISGEEDQMVDTHFSNEFQYIIVYISALHSQKKENIFIYCFCSAIVIINIIVLL